MSRVRLSSYCKVNLCLEILGRRDDGYHELSTIFQTVSLADYLTLQVGGRKLADGTLRYGCPAQALLPGRITWPGGRRRPTNDCAAGLTASSSSWTSACPPAPASAAEAATPRRC